MTEQEPNEEPDEKLFYQKLKDYFWSESRITAMRRISGGILAGGAVCYVPWLLSDALSPDLPPFRVFLILFGIGLLVAHIALTVIEKEPHVRRQTIRISTILFIATVIVVCWMRLRETKPSLALGIFAGPPHGDPLLLTNDFLQLPIEGLTIRSISLDFEGFLVIPILDGATNSAISFALPPSRSVIDGPGIKVLCQTNIHFVCDSNLWIKQADDNPGFCSFAYETKKISPVRGVITKPLIFDTSNFLTKVGPIIVSNTPIAQIGAFPLIVTVTSESTTPMAFGFGVEFLEMVGIKDPAALPKPFVMQGTKKGSRYSLFFVSVLGPNDQWKFYPVDQQINLH